MTLSAPLSETEVRGLVTIKWSPEAYRKVMSSNTSHLEAYAGFFRLLMKGIFDSYVQGPPTHIDAFQTSIFS